MSASTRRSCRTSGLPLDAHCGLLVAPCCRNRGRSSRPLLRSRGVPARRVRAQPLSFGTPCRRFGSTLVRSSIAPRLLSLRVQVRPVAALIRTPTRSAGPPVAPWRERRCLSSGSLLPVRRSAERRPRASSVLFWITGSSPGPIPARSSIPRRVQSTRVDHRAVAILEPRRLDDGTCRPHCPLLPPFAHLSSLLVTRVGHPADRSLGVASTVGASFVFWSAASPVARVSLLCVDAYLTRWFASVARSSGSFDGTF